MCRDAIAQFARCKVQSVPAAIGGTPAQDQSGWAQVSAWVLLGTRVVL